METGVLSQDDIPKFTAGSPAGSLEIKAEALRGLYRESETNAGIQPVLLDASFPGDAVKSIVRKILNAIRGLGRQGQIQFKHFVSDLVVDVMIPCVLCH